MKKRITRKESQLQTRTNLLDAALKVFSRRGYHAASVDEIAAEAGYSKGAVYSNFASKEDLFLALIDRRFAEDAQTYPGIVNFMNDGLKVDVGSDFKGQVLKDRTWNILMVEFFLYAIREGKNRQELSTRLETLRGLMSKNLADIYKQMGRKPSLPIAELPWSVFSLGVGMMLQFYIDQDGLPNGVYERALQQLLR